MSRNLLKSLCLATTALTAASLAPAQADSTRTPIKHVIIVVGENRTFDNLFGAYQPTNGQLVDNLLSKGIILASGDPGPNFATAKQRTAYEPGPNYHVETATTGSYVTLPQPYTGHEFQPRSSDGAFVSAPSSIPDSRFPANLPNGPFQISKYAPYGAYTGDPVHRFFQMWQEADGRKHDKFVWVEETIGTGSNGNPPPSGGFNPKEGGISMGFYNMSAGDAPVFMSLAQQYAISDNYHQAVMGGTGANFQALVTGHAAYFTDWTKLDGSVGTPLGNQIENPNPLSGTNNYYTQDGYGGGSYVECSDNGQPGVKAVADELNDRGVKDRKCAPGHYYLVNNYNLYWNRFTGVTNPVGAANNFTLPPQSAPTIAEVMTKANVSWKYYSADSGNDQTRFHDQVDGVFFPLVAANDTGPSVRYHSYCNICDPLTGYSNIETNASEAAKLQSYGDFVDDLANDKLPAVSFVRPFEAFAAHPANSSPALYEAFLDTLIKRVKGSKAWESTAIFITVDEGGGYYDSGYIQPVDFFGDGTRIPLIVVSPYAKKGYVDHTYYDHVSLLKFIERNWGLPKISKLSRDNLPNPRHNDDSPYVPTNSPAIGDLMKLFAFEDWDDRD
ncbi:alkaline phosphatase family protein [Methylocystis bryophila]|uniref:Phosphoesterase n=1 Tax=Methylocystis bryophila TaxID=655015 RepID=A0A1W6MQV7_9HYPH|nr:alkaline phosphatase family protein [Methylocystis bryophila]ARN79981.1 phosphoesterase [Methylocystis bryophila]BDV39887.1 acid phosphatase [Methylocystis bryophila]